MGTVPTVTPEAISAAAWLLLFGEPVDKKKTVGAHGTLPFFCVNAVSQNLWYTFFHFSGISLETRNAFSIISYSGL